MIFHFCLRGTNEKKDREERREDFFSEIKILLMEFNKTCTSSAVSIAHFYYSAPFLAPFLTRNTVLSLCMIQSWFNLFYIIFFQFFTKKNSNLIFSRGNLAP